MMFRNAIKSTTAIASSSFARPIVARPVVRGVQAQVVKRGYHEKVIDHYENPRNVSAPLLVEGRRNRLEDTSRFSGASDEQS